MRKTVELSKLVERANWYFRQSGEPFKGERKALQSFVGGFLSDADAYQGFRYLTADELPEGTAPGVIHDANGKGQHVFPDDSRISFYWR